MANKKVEKKEKVEKKPKKHEELREYYSVSEAAALLAVSNSWIRQAISTGDLTSIRLGRMHRIPKADIDEFIKKGRK